jgi:hypothetical protein
VNATITPSGKVCANDLFWVDLIMKNPLDAEVSLSNVTVVVQEKSPSEGSTVSDFVEVETIKEVTLGPKATASVSRMPADVMRYQTDGTYLHRYPYPFGLPVHQH